MSISLKIKYIAKERNLSLKNLALQVGISEAGFHKMLKSENFWINDLLKISKALDVSLSKLLPLSLDDIIMGDSIIPGLKNENLELKKRIKEIEEQLDDKRKLINYYEERISSLIGKLPENIKDQHLISNLWEYYLNVADNEYPLFKKLLLTPLAERGKDHENEYKKARKIRKSIFEEKLLSDPEIKKFTEQGMTIKDLMRIFAETDV